MHFFFRHVWRYAWRHKLLAVINILSVGLGVAVYLAVQIANESAIRAFEAGVDLVAGKAHLEARGTIDDRLFPRLRDVTGIVAATPLVEGWVTVVGTVGRAARAPAAAGPAALQRDGPGALQSREYLRIIGIDPLTNSEFRTFQLRNSANDTFDADRWFGEPGAIAITKRFADRHALKEGSSLRVQVGELEKTLQVRFVLEADEADSRVAVMDLGWAQELLEQRDTITTILFRISEPTQAESVIERLRRLSPPDINIQAPEQRSVQVNRMLAGFQLNLTALSLVSLLVGMFLIYNTITASVVRRRGEIGILRTLGASRWQVRWLFLGEALLYAVAGTLLGCAGGVLLANEMVGAVSQTITNLYVQVAIERFYLPLWQIPLTASLGIGCALVGAWMPAAEGARLTPLRALNLGLLIERSRSPGKEWILASLSCVIAALLCGYLALQGWSWSGFLCAFLALGAFCLLTPHITALVCLGCEPLARTSARLRRDFGELSRVGQSSRPAEPLQLLVLATRNLARSLFRNAVTIAALSAALAMLVSVSVMIYSFRVTVDSWIGRRLAADLFIAPATNEIVGFQAFVPEEFRAYLSALPQVDFVDTYRNLTLQIGERPVSLGVVAGSQRNRPRFVGGDDVRKFNEFFAEDTVIVSEPLAHRLKLREGDRIRLPAPVGFRSFRVAGIFYDYTQDAGVMLMQRKNFEKYWHDPRIHSVALYLRPGSQPAAVTEEIRGGYHAASAYSIYSNRDLRSVVFEIFNQTFAVTYLLRTIAIGVAMIGFFLNFTVLVKERERELGILRAVGGSRIQIIWLVLLESAVAGSISIIIGIAAGVALSFVLTEVINRAFFGWSIPLSLPWEQLVMLPLWVLPIALLAALLPAREASRIPIVDAIGRG